MDIQLLIEPQGSESPESKKSSTPIASNSTRATPALSAQTQSPAYAGTSSPTRSSTLPEYASSSPVYGATHVYSTSRTSVLLSLAQGGLVLPAISELQHHQNPSQQPQFRPLYANHQVLAGPNGSSPSQMLKQAVILPEESPEKKQLKWTPEEDNLIIELRNQGMIWDDIAKHCPGRSPISCRLRYQNYLEKRVIWDEEKKNKLARLYTRYVQS